MAVKALLASVRPAMRANLAPGLVLQAFALALVLSYYQLPAVRDFLEQVGELKVRYGYLYSAVSTAIFGGLIPFGAMALLGRARGGRVLIDLSWLLLFWLWRGVEVDGLYRLQAYMLGDEATAATILKKTLVDQFIYNPLWAAPVQALFFLAYASRFSLSAVRARLKRQSLLQRIWVVLFSTWLVWVPAVAIVYSLPGALQLPISNLVVCFWCLFLAILNQQDDQPAAP